MKTNRISIIAVLACVFLAALGLRLGGSQWPQLHPDEGTIAGWLTDSLEHGYVEKRVYPNGFFVLAKPVWVMRSMVSDGANAWRYWTGESDQKTDPAGDRVLFLRQFNAWLGALTCLLVFGLAHRITRSTAAGLTAALLLAFSPQFIEHAHYAETDVAMMFALTLALWLWARTVDLRTGASLLLASAATGFAAGTKFTLFCLVLFIPLHAAFFTPEWPRRGRAARVSVWLGFSILACVAGFALSNVAVVDDLGWWLAGLRQGAAAVYHETRVNMGQAFGDAWGQTIKHLRLMATEFRGMGMGWAVLAAVGFALAPARLWRRHGLTLWVFPAVFVYYLLRVAPWIRPQEVMTLQPVLAVAAAVAVTGLWQAACRPSRWVRAAVVAAVVLAVAWTAVLGARRLSHFTWIEPRLAAKNWMSRHLPVGRATAHEQYTYPVYRVMEGERRGIGKIEQFASDAVMEKGCDYVLRNDHATGRGFRDPRTGKLFAGYQRQFDAFCRDTPLLRAWAPMGGTAACDAQFCGSHIQVRGTVKPPPGPDLPLPVFQPLLAANEGRETFFPVGQDLGCVMGVEVDKYPREIAIGGPLAEGDPVYLVLNTLERSTTVIVEQRGRNQTVALHPYDVAVVRLTPSAVWPRLSEFHRIVLHTERVKHVNYVPCYARVVSGDRQLAAACLQLGRPDRAAAVPGLLDSPTVAAYLVAVREERWADADRLRPLAEESASVLGDYLEGSRSDVSVGGIAAFYRGEFARCRLQTPLQIAELTLRPESAAATSVIGGKWSAASVLRFPLRLPAGPYQLCMKAVARDNPGKGKISITDMTGRLIASLDSEGIGRDSGELVIPMTVGSETMPVLKWSADTKTTILLRDIELRWNERDVLAALADRISEALARHDLARGRSREALAWSAKGPYAPAAAGAFRSLTFDALRAGEGAAFSGTVAAARAVLVDAPRHYEALTCLAASDPPCAEAARPLAGNRPPVLFGGKLAIVGVRSLKTECAAEVVVESLTDDLPALGIALCRRAGREWKRVGFSSLGPERTLRRGERARLVVRAQNLRDISAAFPKDMAVAVESDVEFFPGRLASDGLPGGILPLAE